MEAEVVDHDGDARGCDAAPVGHEVGVGQIAVAVVEQRGDVRVPRARLDADLPDPGVGLRDQLRRETVRALIIRADRGDGAADEDGVGAGLADAVDKPDIAVDEILLGRIGQTVAADLEHHLPRPRDHGGIAGRDQRPVDEDDLGVGPLRGVEA